MLNTYTSYQAIVRDVPRALERIEKQPIVQRETEYFLKNIGTVKSAEEFVNNYRLFNYAMKAHGLEEMTYAKAFILKALNEGLDSKNSFAKKLLDSRYEQFVANFNFAKHAENTTTYNAAVNGTIDNYLARATGNGTFDVTGTAKKETDYFRKHIVDVRSIDDLLNDPLLLDYALQAFHIEDLQLGRTQLFTLLEGGVDDPESPARKYKNENVTNFVAAFDFARLGEKTVSHVNARDDVAKKYIRQTLEEEAGNSNEGVRLALHFKRMVPELKSYEHILADKALTKVMHVTFNLPVSAGGSDLDKKIALFEKKMPIKDFADPEKLTRFLARFTAMWDINEAAPALPSPVLSLFAYPVQTGISADTLLSIASLKR